MRILWYRRTSLTFVKTVGSPAPEISGILAYLNRLSSLLFVLTLIEDQQEDIKVPTYSKDVSSI